MANTRLIFEPEVKSYDPLGDGISKLQYIDHMGDDLSVVNAARVSYQGDREIHLPHQNEKLLHYLLDHGHTSPLEHTAVTFMVECPIFIARQWHRHRIASYNEVSRRYTSEDLKFWYPDSFKVQSQTNKQGGDGFVTQAKGFIYKQQMKWLTTRALNIYEMMIEDNVARELARVILPQNLYTRFYYTANMHSILHFYRLRADSHAQPQIQVYANAISGIMKELYPITWGAAIKNV